MMKVKCQMSNDECQFSNVKLCQMFDPMLFRVFIGPRCPWGPIYGSGCLSQTESKTFLKPNWCDSGWWWYKLNTYWQCGNASDTTWWPTLEPNNASDVKFWIDLQQIRKCIFKRNTKLILRNIAKAKRTQGIEFITWIRFLTKINLK